MAGPPTWVLSDGERWRSCLSRQDESRQDSGMSDCIGKPKRFEIVSNLHYLSFVPDFQCDAML